MGDFVSDIELDFTVPVSTDENPGKTDSFITSFLEMVLDDLNG